MGGSGDPAVPCRPGAPCSPVIRPAFLTGSCWHHWAPGPGALASCPAWGCPGSLECPVPGMQAGTRWLGVPGLRELLSPGALVHASPSPGTRSHRRKMGTSPRELFLLSLQITETSSSQFNIWIFLFKRKGKGLCRVGLFFCPLCSAGSPSWRRRPRPRPLPATGLRWGARCPSPLPPAAQQFHFNIYFCAAFTMI